MDMASALVMVSAEADPRYTGVYMYEPDGGEAPGLGCGRAGLANGDGTDNEGSGTYGDGNIGFGDGETNFGNGDGCGCGMVLNVDQLLKGAGLSWAVGQDGNGYGARCEQYE